MHFFKSRTEIITKKHAISYMVLKQVLVFHFILIDLDILPTLTITTTFEQWPLFSGPEGGRYTQNWLFRFSIFSQTLNPKIVLKPKNPSIALKSKYSQKIFKKIFQFERKTFLPQLNYPSLSVCLDDKFFSPKSNLSICKRHDQSSALALDLLLAVNNSFFIWFSI